MLVERGRRGIRKESLLIGSDSCPILTQRPSPLYPTLPALPEAPLFLLQDDLSCLVDEGVPVADPNSCRHCHISGTRPAGASKLNTSQAKLTSLDPTSKASSGLPGSFVFLSLKSEASDLL